jgi:3-dehydroquinate synthetase/shikimate kinase
MAPTSSTPMSASVPEQARSIALVGLSGSGKSTVGACVADRLGLPFVDLDVLVADRTGRTPAEWIAQDGEPRFREVESSALEHALGAAPVVLATGGGAVIDPLNRWMLAERATTIWLDAPDDLLASRVSRGGPRRPLLGGADPRAALARLRHDREPFYRAAAARVDASADVGRVSDDVIAAARSVTVDGRLFDAVVPRHHPNGPSTARIVLGHDLSRAVYEDVIGKPRQPLVCVDREAAHHLSAVTSKLPAEPILVPGGERAKRLRSVERLLELASARGAERSDPWVAVGGGTIGDLVATAAALYNRGAPLIQVPTTWLAQADSSIGGKAAVDLSHAKNAAGAFWPPVAVISDSASVGTLRRARLLDGMAESLKAGLIGDPQLWSLVEQRGKGALDSRHPDEAARYAITERAVRLKVGVVERDPYERGERRQLNLGHTIGHALEIESRYRLPHGQAVVLGLRAIASISAARAADPSLAERIDTVVAALGFPMQRAFDAAAVKRALTTDKKRVGGRQRWILPIAVGQVIDVDDVSDRELDHALGVIEA